MGSQVRNAVFRHVAGSRINRIDQFEITPDLVIRLGRDPGNEVLYDAKRDDLVSRRHATVRVTSPDGPIFEIADDGSSNGTYVNGTRIETPIELAPDDSVELGKGGPRFVFDIQPRPEGYAGKTRVMSAVDTAATRVMTQASSDLVLPTSAPAAEPPKVGVGKETVQRMMVQERKSANRSWAAIVAMLGTFVVVGGGALYWHSQRTAERVRAEAQARIDQQQDEVIRAKQEANQALTREIGETSRAIVAKYGNATVQINNSWSLYDSATSKPLFLKMVFDRQKTLRPCFVQTREGAIVPWLTLNDENRSNPKIGSSGMGSGFVVSENGFILTNKHVASSWMTKYDWDFTHILIFKEQDSASGRTPRGNEAEVGNLSSKPGEVNNWVPEQDTGLVFYDKEPVRISGWRSFSGHIDEMQVRFPGSRLSMTGNFVRASTDADVALIKIETPQTLSKVKVAEGDELTVGDRVTVLGYPAVSIADKAIVTTNEAGSARIHAETIPQPTVTEGIISKIGYETKQSGTTLTTFSTLGDTFQLSINSTGSGNSGGPVFDRNGEVVGLFTYMMQNGGARVSLAVPIKHGRALFQAQRAP